LSAGERVCLIVQPIHAVADGLLRAAGFTPRLASKSDMTTVASEIGSAAAVITRSAGLNRQAMDAAPNLRAVGSHGVGVNAIDVAQATKLGIVVFNTPEANRASVAEHTIALMLAVAKRVTGGDEATRRTDFDFKYRASLRPSCCGNGKSRIRHAGSRREQEREFGRTEPARLSASVAG
jgi:D-3-phosphoglycerate dehydrogenase / 2-oxoglutarate reductase